MIIRAVSPLLSSVPVRAETTVHDEMFDVKIPKRLELNRRSHDLFSKAYRCMHDLCWFPPARAYVLALYADSGALNRARVAGGPTAVFDAVCEKSFVLFFSSAKDIQHIRKGFRRSFEATKSDHPAESRSECITRFLAVLDGRKGLVKGDRLRVTCLPTEGVVVAAFNEEEGIRIQNAEPLIHWLHSLYLGLESNPPRYQAVHRGLIENRIES